MGVLKADRETFAIEQANRVQQLKNYLDEKMRVAIAEFNRVTEADLFTIKGDMYRIQEHMSEAAELVTKASKLRLSFETVQRSGKMMSGIINSVK